MLETKGNFLKKYNIAEKDFKKTKLKWVDLEAIYNDYESKIVFLNSVGQSISNTLQGQPSVHSVRFRVKDAEHLIEKIIRKVKEQPTRIINIANYETEITDLIGVRAIHLFKSNWSPINQFIKDTWEVNEPPIAYIRAGDSDVDKTIFETEEFNVKEHTIGYRSLHYIIKTKPTKVEYFVEIQVRTIFEEGWSEIDHKIRYPYDVDNDLIRKLLMIFNRLAGSADEMADYIQTLGLTLHQRELDFEVSLQARESEINTLKDEISQMRIKPEQKDKLINSVEHLTRTYPSNIGTALNLIGTKTLFGEAFDWSKLNNFSDSMQSINKTLAHLGKMQIQLNGIPIAKSYDAHAIKGNLNKSNKEPENSVAGDKKTGQ